MLLIHCKQNSVYFKQDLDSENPLVEKYNKEGKLTIDEFVALIKSVLDEKFKVGENSVISGMISCIPPKEWVVIKCRVCNKPIHGAILIPKKN